MGNCSSNAITIDLNRANMFYFTGETATGTPSLHITNGQLELDEIFITLTSEIGYMTYKTVTNNKGETRTQAERHYVPFYSAKVSFERPDVRQRELVYSQGRYSWPFQIPLTNQLPPTINEPHLFPHVRYYLQAVIDKSWYKPNTRYQYYNHIELGKILVKILYFK